MLKKLLLTTLCLFSLSALANDVRVELEGSDRIDSWTKRGNMMLQATASDNKLYKVRLSCITAENNHAQRFATGELHVYKGTVHVGAKATFTYEECLSIYDGLKNKAIKLVLDWDKESYDANFTGKASLSVIEL